MFGIGAGEAIALLVLGLLIFGPERLPRLVAETIRVIRQVRGYATEASRQVREAVDPQVREILTHTRDDVESLRRFDPLAADAHPPRRGKAPRYDDAT